VCRWWLGMMHKGVLMQVVLVDEKLNVLVVFWDKQYFLSDV